MINTCKITQIQPTAKIVAGLLPSDSNIEFIGVPENQTVIWLQHGSTRRFEDLSGENYQILWQYYHQDKGARAYLGNMSISLERQVELYIYYMCGQVDSTPDLVNGKLNFSENFRETENCPSLLFDKKFITVGNVKLSGREIRIIDLIKQDYPDKAIAAELKNRNGEKGISLPTYDFHKRKLFKKLGVMSKPALLLTVLNAGI